MSFKDRFPKWLRSDWFQTLLLFLIFLAIKGYKYNWDDQHLEIPLLKSLIDPTLYLNDYYVQSLKSNFCSYFYPLLARVISVKQIPAAYLTLYLISKYFLFFWVYKIWFHITKQKSIAFICCLAFMTFGRTSELHYRTFSHQEFAMPFVVAGLYFFYKERFVVASAILGAAANFHFLYSILPAFYMFSYLTIFWKKHGGREVIKSFLSFLLFISPIIFWMVKKNIPLYLAKPADSPIDWISLYRIACFQNFIFFGVTFQHALTHLTLWFSVAQEYLLLIALYALNAWHNETFRKDKKVHAIFFAAFFLMAVSYIFTYIKPTRLVLDLNLVRNTQYLFFFLSSYTTFFIIKILDTKSALFSFGAILLFESVILSDALGILTIGSLALLLWLNQIPKSTFSKAIQRVGTAAIFSVCIFEAWKVVTTSPEEKAKLAAVIILSTASICYIIVRIFQRHAWLKRSFIILPVAILLVFQCSYHIKRMRTESAGGGFWKLQRDWEDMQHYVQINTPKNAVILAPNDTEMGGFRVNSERTLVCCYRDCGIVGFDYNAGVEWLKRIRDIWDFKVVREGDIQPAVLKGIFKYKANYIVFMRYYAPRNEQSKLYTAVYENDSFSLYKVALNNPS